MHRSAAHWCTGSLSSASWQITNIDLSHHISFAWARCSRIEMKDNLVTASCCFNCCPVSEAQILISGYIVTDKCGDFVVMIFTLSSVCPKLNVSGSVWCSRLRAAVTTSSKCDLEKCEWNDVKVYFLQSRDDRECLKLHLHAGTPLTVRSLCSVL